MRSLAVFDDGETLPRSGDWMDTATVSRGRASTITTDVQESGP